MDVDTAVVDGVDQAGRLARDVGDPLVASGLSSEPSDQLPNGGEVVIVGEGTKAGMRVGS